MSLVNLFNKKTDKIIFARIVEKNTNTSYLVRDLREREFKVESSGEYLVGQSVSVKSGIIIAKAKTPKNISHFNV